MERNYNYLRKKLMLPEYGRHIHEMIDYLRTIEDRPTRNHQARAVIAVMGNLNSQLRDNADTNHKLWDHLFIMAGFDLDVDSPYPTPSPELIAVEPRRLAYTRSHIRQKHYGKYVQQMVCALEKVDDRPAVEQTIGNIAKFMRTKSFEYNEEHPDNSVIIRDIKNMSENVIAMDENALNNIKSDYKQQSFLPPKKGWQQNFRQNFQNNKNNGERHRHRYTPKRQA
ncbi:MAG: DUF4290 domain-containing protein [Rikenellaceae bacterium]|jgi:hypothetical protein|nr:DUF4290 domain-containing protein [Rikenellaceae bacterium]